MLLVLAVCGLAVLPAESARAQNKAASMVIDANTGKVLHEQFADAPRHPASLTKMMTLYMVFSEIEAGRLSYDTKIKVSTKAAGVAPSKLELEAGDEIEVLDAVKALITKSANDMAVALAEHIGGNEVAFSRMMTERARQIGMRSTLFFNASGLPDPRQITTARDMLTLALRLQDDFPKHYRLFSLTSFTYRGKTYRSHNTLMHGFPGMDGIKTGYTRASGFNLVSSVKTDNKHIVAAVFGGKTAAARNAHMRMLLYRALEGASTERTRKGSQMLVASARPVIKQTAVETMDVAWSTETKSTETKAPKKAAEKPVKPPAKAAAKVPPPTPAVRPAPPQVAAERSAPPAGRDQIAQVLSNSAPPSAPPGNGGTVVAAAQPLASPPRLDLEALREAMSEENEPQGDASATAAAPPVQASAAPGPQDIASLIRNSIVEGAPTARTLPNPQADAATARPPSTLDSQASALTAAYRAPAQDTGSLRVADAGRTASPPPGLPPSHLQGPQAARAPAGSAYEIQIGAYSTAVEAQTKLEAVRTRANALLQGHTGVTIPVQRADRQMYRARFVNFNEQAASNTCLELRRLAIDCFVMKAE